MLGYFDYPDRNNMGAFTLSLGANYVDGISNKWGGSTNFRINGSLGSLEVGWNEVRLKTTYDIDEKKQTFGKRLEDISKSSENIVARVLISGRRGIQRRTLPPLPELL